MSSGLEDQLSKRTFLGMKLWAAIGVCFGVFIGLMLYILSLWLTFRKKPKRTLNSYTVSEIPNVAKDTRVDRLGGQNHNDHPESLAIIVNDKSSDKISEKMIVHLGVSKSGETDNISQCSSVCHHKRTCSSHSGEEGSSGTGRKQSSYGISMASPLIGLPELSHLGGQAEKEFSVEVEAMGHVRHKNLVRLLGYCVGVHRMLVYEYVNNGNLEQWLHGSMRQHGVLTWEARMKVLLGTAKALTYLHEAIEPKAVHRDIKASNILIDHEFNSKVSDFGLAKLLDSSESHITTRVMGTFGYVAPEYANTGMLNEKSDIYSFGVLLLEAVTGRDPVDYGRPANEVNLVEWLKMMVGSRRAEEVVDPDLETKPPTRALKHALLVALRCVDPDSGKQLKMSQDRRNRKTRTESMEIESMKETTDTVETGSKAEESELQKSDTLRE